MKLDNFYFNWKIDFSNIDLAYLKEYSIEPQATVVRAPQKFDRIVVKEDPRGRELEEEENYQNFPSPLFHPLHPLQNPLPNFLPSVTSVTESVAELP